MLVALNGVIRARGSAGTREISASDFHRLPADTPDIETVLEPGEIVVGVSVLTNVLSRQSHYLKVRDRSSYEFASVSVAAAADFSEDGAIRDARMALGGLSTKPWLVKETARCLAGRRPDDRAAFDELADIALAGARPQSGNSFKVPQARGAIARAFQTLAHRYGGER